MRVCLRMHVALAHAPLPTEHLKPWSRIEHHDAQGIRKYLGVAVLGVGVLGVTVLGVPVLGVAVLGTTVLHPQTRPLSTQHSLTRLFPQSISQHGVA
jgi:hypothetical protein